VESTLLSRKIARFLVENDFFVAISLDGPEEEHNRNRKYKGGKGSFSEVFQGIVTLVQEIKNLGKEHILPYTILTCFDRRTNLDKVKTFFADNVEALGTAGRANYVKPFFTSYYNDLTVAEEKIFQMQYRNLEEDYFKAVQKGNLKLKDIFLERLIGESWRNLYIRAITTDGRHLSPLIGGCIPGAKIAVDCDGNFHLCEKINYNFPIGNYIEGIEMKKITEILQKWKDATIKCASCLISGVLWNMLCCSRY
jgi:uncharacterized protein